MASLLASTTKLSSASAVEVVTVFWALQLQLVAPHESLYLKQKPEALLLSMFPAQSASDKFNKSKT